MCAVTQHQCTAALFRAKCSPHCSVLLCKPGYSMQCVIALTPMEICSFIQVCSDPTLCTVALFGAKCSPHCSVLLCKPGYSMQCVIAPMQICSFIQCTLLCCYYCPTIPWEPTIPAWRRRPKMTLTWHGCFMMTARCFIADKWQCMGFETKIAVVVT